MIIFGIDPGKSGGIAVFDGGGLTALLPIPLIKVVVNKKNKKLVDVHGCRSIFDKYKPELTVIEAVYSRSRQGVTSVFDFGFTTGVLHGLASCGRIETANPVKWKNHFKLIGKEKKDSLDLARTRFSGFSKELKLKKSEGLAEAALIGLWWLETLNT